MIGVLHVLQVAGEYTAEVTLESDGFSIGTHTLELLPGPMDAATSELTSPADHSSLTAGDTLTLRVLPHDEFGNDATPTDTQTLVAVIEYSTVGPRAAGAAAVAAAERVELSREAGGGDYGPWVATWVAEAAGAVSIVVQLEASADGATVLSLPSVSATVRCPRP